MKNSATELKGQNLNDEELDKVSGGELIREVRDNKEPEGNEQPYPTSKRKWPDD